VRPIWQTRLTPLVIRVRGGFLGQEIALSRSRVELARTHKLVVGVTDRLYLVSNPADRARECKDRRKHGRRYPERLHDQPRIEINVGIKLSLYEIRILEGNALELKRRLVG
jgi:hypothetical protein